MRQLKLVIVVCLIGTVSVTDAVTQAPRVSASAMLFEGARLITGDGSAPIENAAFLVENNRFTRVGR
jgi:hypothetical protein